MSRTEAAPSLRSIVIATGLVLGTTTLVAGTFEVIEVLTEKIDRPGMVERQIDNCVDQQLLNQDNGFRPAERVAVRAVEHCFYDVLKQPPELSNEDVVGLIASALERYQS